jgi:methylase of polypeptide subunit release factors
MINILIENKKIYYDKHLNGGGASFGIAGLKMDSIIKHINKGKILEMCSGPGYMGFYLNFIGRADELYLSDINSENFLYIKKTIEENNLTNTKFIESDSFKSFNLDIKFDTIICNPPHFFESKNFKDYYSKLLSVDLGFEFHKNFFNEAHNYMNESSKIIMIEYLHGIPPNTLKKLLPEHMIVIYFIQISNHLPYYVSIIKLKDNFKNENNYRNRWI